VNPADVNALLVFLEMRDRAGVSKASSSHVQKPAATSVSP